MRVVMADASSDRALTLDEIVALPWGERYAYDCFDHCPTRPDGHTEGCPIHCGCFE